MFVNKDGRLSIVFFIPDEDDDDHMVKKVEYYECFEMDDVIKTYKNIKGLTLIEKAKQ